VLLEPLLRALVEPREGLVEQENPRPGEDEPREGKTPLHARREGANTRVGGAIELDGGEGAGPVGGGRSEPGQRRPERQILGGGQVLVHIGAVGDEPDLAADELGVLRAIVAGDGRDPACWTHQGRQDLEQGRLAGAVGAQHRHRLAGLDVEVDAVQDAMVAEGLAETGHSDECLGGHG